ncbi:hydroxyethylthiazole kinase [Paenibacillus apiarius]|uniref:Hydroxyethylthiazole kinase n=1 Tax=Paenibacillus apiarius TaxID=46240 RepID=A0ABT4DSP1_9BACL|nr:hydroxyethylthiazole kinase [Paenibacillus apiarius]MBN3523827.1 hydroxyethylthiazole kinase [Paenibacillus apiarius]MCY9514142.1 hydroxyethylthiazole kinase [Paenibacillus apiarius]MCY9520265.1 hydroxyethylthiazole kinase [Paenibacillus apiarius]MCY9550393.1 hydroxyethylthiazole kinase [Paenibacillus apiarius]MCY9557455.1 hydroxyethylthiazole kinase [Paenibacillus apiarius]
MTVHLVSALIEKLHQEQPLIHNMTNVVVTNFTANGLLALGASPVMAYAPEEVADMAKLAGALVLNLGTLSKELVEAMIVAGQAANAHGVPVLLDPVGAGATPFRTASALRILREVEVSLIRGNAAEVAHLNGEHRAIKGVDAGHSADDERADLAVRAAKNLQTVVAVTGPEDVITDGQAGYIVKGGHRMLAQVTGAGCLLTSVLGAFAAVEPDMLLAGTAGLAFYGAAAYEAAARTEAAGPGSFQIALIDELSRLNRDSLATHTEVREFQPSFVKEGETR